MRAAAIRVQMRVKGIFAGLPFVLVLMATTLGVATPAMSDFGDQAPFSRVIIDAGHGGKDEGAIGLNGIREKELVLDVSSRLGRLLEARDLKVVLTRDADRFVPLEVRTSRANDARGDLHFTNIQCFACNANFLQEACVFLA